MLMEFAKYDLSRGVDEGPVWVNTRSVLSMSRPQPQEEGIYRLNLSQGHVVDVRMSPEQFQELLDIHEQYDP